MLAWMLATNELVSRQGQVNRYNCSLKRRRRATQIYKATKCLLQPLLQARAYRLFES